MEFILDFGSGNTCQNDKKYVEKMVSAVADLRSDDKKDVIIKWQLFEKAEPNIPLKHDVFEYAYNLGQKYGFKTTASVFDKKSLKFLEGFDVPFIKIACRKELYKLAEDVKGKVYMSVPEMPKDKKYTYLCCVPEYPASRFEYYGRFMPEHLEAGISDHTVGWKMFTRFQPKIYEKHFILERTPGNPDVGGFSVTPKELKGII